jgi:hypothetical protein
VPSNITQLTQAQNSLGNAIRLTKDHVLPIKPGGRDSLPGLMSYPAPPLAYGIDAGPLGYMLLVGILQCGTFWLDVVSQASQVTYITPSEASY